MVLLGLSKKVCPISFGGWSDLVWFFGKEITFSFICLKKMEIKLRFDVDKNLVNVYFNGNRSNCFIGKVSIG